MTYINAFKSPRGIVMSADTQETVEEEINYREKIEIGRWPLIEAAIGGAGHGDLVDGFIKFVFGRLRRLRNVTLEQLDGSLDSALQHFYNNDVKLCRNKNKNIAFLIATRNPKTTEISLWATKGARAIRIKKNRHVAIGYEAPFCSYVARRYFNPDLSLSQLVLLSAYLVAVAKTATKHSGLDTSIVIIRDNGIWEEKAEYIRWLEPRLETYEKHVTNLFLSCADTSLSVVTLADYLKKFSETALALHRDHINAYLRGLTLQDVTGTNEPYSKMPVGTHVVFGLDGKIQDVAHDPAKSALYDQHARIAADYFRKQGLVEYVIRRMNADRFLVSLSKRWEGVPDVPVGELTREQLCESLSEAKPFSGEALLEFLADDGFEIVVYAEPPRPSSSQMLEDQK